MFGLADAAIAAAIKFLRYLEAAGPDWKKDFLSRRREAYRAERRARTADPHGNPRPKTDDTETTKQENPDQNSRKNPNESENPTDSENPNESENPTDSENPNESENPNVSDNPNENANENPNKNLER